jgi:hypothetical protein
MGLRLFAIVCAAAGFLSACTTAEAQKAPATSTATFVEACASDAKQFCPAAKPGSGEVTKCLRDNTDKLSQFCKQALATARAQPERKN